MAQFVFAQNCNYENYPKQLNWLLREYANENFKEANKLLKIAFDTIDFPFGIDLRMAFKSCRKDWR
ncbi:hypothetical protein [Flavobacterium sp. FlaQc-48]|uniref:hypothetical protein n=1 Tax=Flavobacterium sp. FlaQc-48 TaxID=3374181 RepID=UPI0037576E70